MLDTLGAIVLYWTGRNTSKMKHPFSYGVPEGPMIIASAISFAHAPKAAS
jgi:hypothetical protein